MSALLSLHDTIFPHLLSPIHEYFPISPIDLFGALRLSLIVDWAARGLFSPPPPLALESSEAIALLEKGDVSAASRVVEAKRTRAGVLQECFGILVVVFGGETFLALCSGTTPSWMLSPKVALLFSLAHILQTRTPLRRLLPSKPTLSLELLLTLPDAIGRTLLLTQFSVIPLLHSSPSPLPATPTTLLLTPFIMAVPFASLIFSTTDFFSPVPKFGTPAEMREGGWMMVDFWIPIVLPALFLCLVGPVTGWQVGLDSLKRWGKVRGMELGVRRLDEREAMVVCFFVCWVVFVVKTIYNLGSSRENWIKMLGVKSKRRARKIKRS